MPICPCITLHYDIIYILFIVNWILLLKDFLHQACWKLFEVLEVTIRRGIKLERTDIVGFEGNVALPSRLRSLRSVVRYLSGVRGNAPAKNEFGSF